MIRYTLFFWTPPILTPEQEIEIGRLIVLEGREKFLQRAPFQANRRGRVDFRNFGMRQWIILIAFVALIIPGLIVFWLPMLIACFLIGIYSGGSFLLSRYYYGRWVDKMIGKYATAVAHDLGATNA